MAAAKSNKQPSYEGMKRRLKIWFFVVALFMGWALYTLYSQLDGHDQAEKKLVEVQQKIDEATKQMSDLQVQIDRLNDPEYIEQLATKYQNMVKPGERPIRVAE